MIHIGNSYNKNFTNPFSFQSHTQPKTNHILHRISSKIFTTSTHQSIISHPKPTTISNLKTTPIPPQANTLYFNYNEIRKSPKPGHFSRTFSRSARKPFTWQSLYTLRQRTRHPPATVTPHSALVWGGFISLSVFKPT